MRCRARTQVTQTLLFFLAIEGGGLALHPPGMARAQEAEEPGAEQLTESQREQELAQTQIKMAELYEGKDDLDSAIKIWRELLASYPHKEEYLAQLCRLLIQLQRYQEALAPARELVRQKPQDARYQGWLATVLVALKQPEQALPHAEELAKKGTSDVEVRESLAQAYELSKKPAEALKQYDYLVARFPENVEYRITRAHLYGDLGQPRRQQAELEAALKLLPAAKRGPVHRELAALFFGQEKYDRAMVEYRALLRLEPNDQKAQQQIRQIETARAQARRRSEEEYREYERYLDWQLDLQDRAEDF